MTLLDALKQVSRLTEQLPAFILQVESFQSLEQASIEAQGRLDKLRADEADLSVRLEERVVEEATTLVEKRTIESKAAITLREVEAKGEADAVIARAEAEARTTLEAANAAVSKLREEAKHDVSKLQSEAESALRSRDALRAELETLELRLVKVKTEYGEFLKKLP